MEELNQQTQVYVDAYVPVSLWSSLFRGVSTGVVWNV